MPIHIIIPEIKEERQVKSGFQEEWFKKMEEMWNPPLELPNIEFHYHHEDFFNRNFSIRAARDWQNHPFWFYVAMLLFIAGLAWSGFTIGFKWIYPFIPVLPRSA